MTAYLGKMCFRSGDYSCAAAAYGAASELAPDNRFYRMNLDSAFRRLAPYENNE